MVLVCDNFVGLDIGRTSVAGFAADGAGQAIAERNFGPEPDQIVEWIEGLGPGTKTVGPEAGNTKRRYALHLIERDFSVINTEMLHAARLFRAEFRAKLSTH